jgi:NADH dehydrogenase
MEHVGKRRSLVPVPFFVWDAMAALLSGLANPPLTRDQVKLMKSDNMIGEAALTLEDLGIDPTPVEEVLPTYIHRSPNPPAA